MWAHWAKLNKIFHSTSLAKPVCFGLWLILCLMSFFSRASVISWNTDSAAWIYASTCRGWWAHVGFKADDARNPLLSMRVVKRVIREFASVWSKPTCVISGLPPQVTGNWYFSSSSLQPERNYFHKIQIFQDCLSILYLDYY